MIRDLIRPFNRSQAENPPPTPPPCTLLPRKRPITPSNQDDPAGVPTEVPKSSSFRSWHRLRPSKSSLPADQIPLQTHNQAQSPFFNKLPYELREIVYTELLGAPGTLLHVRRLKNDGLRAVACYEDHTDGPLWNHPCWMFKQHARSQVPQTEPSTGPYSTWGEVRIWPQVLRVCRRIYTESIPLLYTNPTLNFREDQSLACLPKYILPHRLHTIRSIRFDTQGVSTWSSFTAHPDHWLGAWSVLRSLRGLKQLHVSLDAQWLHHPELIPGLLEPMREVNVEDYQVVIYCNQDLGEVVAALGALPFVVTVLKPVRA